MGRPLNGSGACATRRLNSFFGTSGAVPNFSRRAAAGGHQIIGTAGRHLRRGVERRVAGVDGAVAAVLLGAIQRLVGQRDHARAAAVHAVGDADAARHVRRADSQAL